MTPDLLPCPFCGGVESVRPYSKTCDKTTPYDPADRAYPIVRCGCGVEVSGKNWTSVSTAIEAWNRRAAQSAVLDADARRWRKLCEIMDTVCDDLRIEFYGRKGFSGHANAMELTDLIDAALAANPPATVKGAT